MKIECKKYQNNLYKNRLERKKRIILKTTKEYEEDKEKQNEKNKKNKNK